MWTQRVLAPVLGALLGCAGCARAVSYLDPQGPAYRFSAAEPRAASTAPAARTPLRVVTFNVEYALRVDAALDAIAASPSLARPDLLALQEMDAPGVERMARALGMNAVYFPSGVHPKHRRDFGCALLSPWPLEEPRKLVLPHGARVTGLRRSAVTAVLVRGPLRLRVYAVHLPSPLAVSGGSRSEQVRVLLADASRESGPVVIAGDLNSHDLGRELVAGGFDWPTREVGATAHWRSVGLSYDHVFCRGLSVIATGVEQDNRKASDHRPVWALLARDEAALLRASRSPAE